MACQIRGLGISKLLSWVDVVVVSLGGLQISEAAGARSGTHHSGRSLESSGPSRSDSVQGPAIARQTTSWEVLKLAVIDTSIERIIFC
jgi:hypothetical protein